MLAALPLKGATCAEIGVLHGDFSSQIKAQDPRSLFLIDPWKAQDIRAYADINNHSQEVFDEMYLEVCERFKPGNSVYISRMFSHEAARHYALRFAHQFDFIYIDANHSYSGVLSDLFMWYPLMRRGGWLAGHDYKALPFYGVTQAVEEFCRITGNEVAIETQEPLWKSFAIQIGG